MPAKLRVCWFLEKTYWVYVFRQQIKTRFELVTSSGGPPTEFRWFLDKVPLADGESSIAVTFQAASSYFGPPKNVAASSAPGGAGTLKYKTAGPVLEIWNEGGRGVFFGTVTVLYGFAGDPTLSPTFPVTPDQLLVRDYEHSDELAITAVDFMMDQQWVDDVTQCARTVDEIDRKHLLVDVHIGPPNPGDPPPYRDQLLQRAAAAAHLANAVGMRMSSDAVELTPNVLGVLQQSADSGQGEGGLGRRSGGRQPGTLRLRIRAGAATRGVRTRRRSRGSNGPPRRRLRGRGGMRRR